MNETEPTKIRVPRPQRVLCAHESCMKRVWSKPDTENPQPVFCQEHQAQEK